MHLRKLKRETINTDENEMRQKKEFNMHGMPMRGSTFIW